MKKVNCMARHTNCTLQYQAGYEEADNSTPRTLPCVKYMASLPTNNAIFILWERPSTAFRHILCAIKSWCLWNFLVENEEDFALCTNVGKKRSWKALEANIELFIFQKKQFPLIFWMKLNEPMKVCSYWGNIFFKNNVIRVHIVLLREINKWFESIHESNLNLTRSIRNDMVKINVRTFKGTK